MKIALQLGFNLTIVVHSSLWRSKMNWNIEIPISLFLLVINFLHCVKFWWDSVQWPQSLRRKKLSRWLHSSTPASTRGLITAILFLQVHQGQSQTNCSTCWMLLRVLSVELWSSTVVSISCCMTSSTGSTSLIEFSLRSQWQFTSVWTAAHHRTCRITAHRFPLVHVDIYVPPTATYL